MADPKPTTEEALELAESMDRWGDQLDALYMNSRLCRESADTIRALVAENERLARDRDIYLGGIELLVQQEVISAARARELHGMTPDEQRQYWRDNHYKWRPE